MPSPPLFIWKCPVPCFQPTAAVRGGPPFAGDGCSYTAAWGSCLWSTQLLWSTGLGLRQSLGHRICQDCAPFCGVPPQSIWYCGGVMKLFFRLTAMQVLNSWGSFQHATKIWPPVQVCPSYCVSLDIRTSFIQIWQVVGNTFLTKFNEITYVGVEKKMEIGPGEERLWREGLGKEMSWQSQVLGNVSYGLCLLRTKESSLWTQMNKEAGCSGLLLLELFDSFSRIS